MDLLSSEFELLLTCATQDEFLNAMEMCAKQLGYKYCSALMVQETAAEERLRFRTVECIPPGFEHFYKDFTDFDPVMSWSKNKSVPLAWGQEFYEQAGAGERWEEMARFGMKNGLASTMHMPNGRHFCMGFEGPEKPWKTARELTLHLGTFQMLLVHAEAASARLDTSTASSPVKRNISPRELECLKWTAAGKTAWEVGEIMNIGERTVVKHIESLVAKMECTNKLHAAARAIREGII